MTGTNLTEEKLISWCEHGKMLVCEICALKTEVKTLKQQVNTLTKALKKIATMELVDGSATDEMLIARKALQSIKESPREEQGK
ncbi:hypothetical protein [Paenibacillus ginsengarvi]|uniref:Uncharacterized protein n=1 Tax=Paenibacillus ginsengarvi TaxID=400777 RepID=A0A3B0CYR1_9BACL|nr:hypothetical protein [Paenibacillus ginsengarvi]RKN86766.1 hypothetical protein D7M11_02065 [Paenibacillus ginsengarvi]